MQQNDKTATTCYVTDSLNNAERSFINLREKLAHISEHLNDLIGFIEALEDIADREDIAHKDVVKLAKKIGKLRLVLDEELLKELF